MAATRTHGAGAGGPRRGHRIFAALYDRLGAGRERRWLGPRRAALLAGAAGRVLEVGAGTGANLPHYGEVEELILTEPDPAMRRRLERTADALGPRVRVEACPAEDLPVADGSVDAVVATLALCSVGSQRAALAEMRRVLRPGGRLLFIEHVRADGRRGRRQDRVTPIWRRVSAGCHPNRETVAAIRSAGFEITRLERHDEGAPGPSLARPIVIGAAVRPPDDEPGDARDGQGVFTGR